MTLVDHHEIVETHTGTLEPINIRSPLEPFHRSSPKRLPAFALSLRVTCDPHAAIRRVWVIRSGKWSVRIVLRRCNF